MERPINKPKIAIACQGGGSQTAFTAGVLHALTEARVEKDFDLVSLSGTSGGAVCATLLWYALKKGDERVWDRLLAFWHDNTPRSTGETSLGREPGRGLVVMPDGRRDSAFANRILGSHSRRNAEQPLRPTSPAQTTLPRSPASAPPATTGYASQSHLCP